MIKSDPYYKRLVLGFISNSISVEQVKELYEFINREPEKYSVLMDEPEVLFKVKQQMQNAAPEISSEVDQKFQERIKQAVEYAKSNTKQPHTHRAPLLRLLTNKKWFRYAAAAAILVIIATTAVVVSSDRQHTNSGKDLSRSSSKNTDIAPGHNGAILTLANGQKILLDSLGNGVVTTQGKTTIAIQNGKLVYDASAKSGEVLYNTMTTPKGRQYQLILPDGSQVWLNAASSITYPTVFAGTDRSVTITGEAYFEVAKDKSKPFHVRVNDMDVEVLGTHFNINSYADEAAINTTLLEGSVRVSKSGQIATLKPGQQAKAVSGELSVVSDVNMDEVMAWKNGKFQFNRTPLPVVMRQLSRWYDVDVEYVGNIPNVVFAGKMGRDLNLSQVLIVLNKMEVNFKIEGKKLIVMP